MRTCFFCYHVYGVRFVEDEYQFFFQCPSYEQPRYLFATRTFHSIILIHTLLIYLHHSFLLASRTMSVS